MSLKCMLGRCRERPYKRFVRYSYNSFEDDEPTVKHVNRYCRPHALLMFLLYRNKYKGFKTKWTPIYDRSGNVVSEAKDKNA